MKKICITGGIACGKNRVGDKMRQLGAPVIDADDVCHELMRAGGPLVRRIVSAFGKTVLDGNGGIDRRVLGRIIFADAQKREKLNALVHPAARRAINAWFKARGAFGRRTGARALFAAALVPLAYEAGWDRGWDAMVCVAAPELLQVSRLRAKGFSAKEARARIAAQMPLAEKMSKADHVIFNAGTISGLHLQTALVFRNVKAKLERYNGRKK